MLRFTPILLAILYAIAVGAGPDELDLVYEKRLRVLPTLACALGLWAVEAAGEHVVCAWFTEDMPVGPGGWAERGWRAMNVQTGVGLGRMPHESFEACLDATRAAPGAVVCTNTGVGFKGTHVETNTWCGSSSSLSPCLAASRAARGGHVCSFPSDGDGTGPGWVLTRIGASCACSASTPTPACSSGAWCGRPAWRASCAVGAACGSR